MKTGVCKNELILLARRILDKDIGIIEASRTIARNRFDWECDREENINIFLTVDSESDHLPVGIEKENWEPGALAEKNKEIEEIENFYRADVEAACQHIVNED